MTTDGEGRRVLSGELIAPRPRGRQVMQMPSETPLGIGILGELRFDAIRRVIAARERALRAIEAHLDAETDVDRAIMRRAIALDQLRNVDLHIARATAEADELAHLAGLKRRLERLQLEEQIAIVEERSRGRGGASAQLRTSRQRFLDVLAAIPEVAKTARDAKDELVRQAGGIDQLTNEDQEHLSAIDQIFQEFIAREGEGAR